MKTRFAIAVLCIVALLVGATALRAQRPTAPADRDSEVTAGLVIASPDLGFRVDHYNGSTPVGELVVKRDGKWIPVEFGAKIKPVR